MRAATFSVTVQPSVTETRGVGSRVAHLQRDAGDGAQRGSWVACRGSCIAVGVRVSEIFSIARARGCSDGSAGLDFALGRFTWPQAW